jgi:hypothetical protein
VRPSSPFKDSARVDPGGHERAVVRTGHVVARIGVIVTERRQARVKFDTDAIFGAAGGSLIPRKVFRVRTVRPGRFTFRAILCRRGVLPGFANVFSSGV